eukprot:GHVU01097975.1.p4 GENE.GHVU01097975.1~~GHVU01097975.1.p4  ORF type:complete len:113 (+),score=5.99 GHVU01097975.1:1457-1795(+)
MTQDRGMRAARSIRRWQQRRWSLTIVFAAATGSETIGRSKGPPAATVRQPAHSKTLWQLSSRCVVITRELGYHWNFFGQRTEPRDLRGAGTRFTAAAHMNFVRSLITCQLRE